MPGRMDALVRWARIDAGDGNKPGIKRHPVTTAHIKKSGFLQPGGVVDISALIGAINPRVHLAAVDPCPLEKHKPSAQKEGSTQNKPPAE